MFSDRNNTLAYVFRRRNIRIRCCQGSDSSWAGPVEKEVMSVEDPGDGVDRAM
jgi:hypothetical protein